MRPRKPQPPPPEPAFASPFEGASWRRLGVLLALFLAAATTQAQVPGAPFPIVASFTAGEIYVLWSEPPDTGGSPISSYDLQYVETDEETTAEWTLLTGVGTQVGPPEGTNPPEFHYTITGLEVDTTYTVQVRAVNASGAGPWSLGYTATTLAELPNQEPLVVGTLPDLRLALGSESVDVDVAPAFEDPEGDALTFSAFSKDTRIATMTISGSIVTVSPVGRGRTAIVVTARDEDGSDRPVQTAFDVAVDQPEVTVSFGSTSYRVTEGSSVTVIVTLTQAPGRTVLVGLVQATLGGATVSDYTGVPDLVRFLMDETRQEFTIEATDDSDDDDGESVKISFSTNPGVIAGSPTTVALVDNDGVDSGGDGDGGGGGGGGGDGGGGDGDGTPPDNDPDTTPSGPPEAAFTVDAECADGLCRARTGVAVRFTDTSTGRVASRTWDFGKGKPVSRSTVDYAWAEPGFYDVTLTVTDGSQASAASKTFLVEAAEPRGTCVANAETLCLHDSRYAVTVDWRIADGDGGRGRVVHAGTNDSGMFWFFGPNNWEVLIKVLDGCALNGHVWVFGAATTDLGYSIRVTDTLTGTVREHGNEPGMPAPAITDVAAFAEGCR